MPPVEALTPNAQSRPGADGGYLLTITCVCVALPGAPRLQARGVAVGAALQPLWECAAEKVAALERTPTGG